VNAAAALASWTRAVVSTDPLVLGLRLTLLDLLLRPIGGPWIRPLSLALAALGLLVPVLLERPGLWLALAALAAARVVGGWPLADNHAYLLGYWCLAAWIALRDAGARASLAWNARLLVGLAFAFATLWKVGLSDDFLDGRFFRAAFVIDQRFEGVARGVGGLEPEQLAELRAFVGVPVAGELPPLPDAPAESPRLRTVARGAALWTAAIEAAVALAFLLPARALATMRDPLLLLFCATTYAVAPVEGFAWLLLAMGAAQSDPGRLALRLAYVATFGLVLVYRHALADWLLHAL
jgi:hypothetical protein